VEIRKAGQRAASLTRQLLAFSRQQVLEPKVLRLNAVVSDIEKMLRRLIGEDIELTTELAANLGHVKADQGQMEQVIMNLAVNARDAIPSGGKLVIETKNVEVDQEVALQRGYINPGSFVMIAVTDTGMGMDAETQSHIFEPFFTTKEQGKGTGLGLATVYGVVKQSDGFVWVYSEPGHGARFEVLLPRVEEPAHIALKPANSRSSRSGSETILLVEDDDSLRGLATTILSESGYAVLEAANGAGALTLAREKSRGQIHLLLSDVVMPGMSGPQVADEVSSIHPDMKILFMSGYSEFAAGHDQISRPGRFLLQKPFTQQELTSKVREVLDVCEAVPSH
jgi:CheY-like chemotaxis protein